MEDTVDKENEYIGLKSAIIYYIIGLSVFAGTYGFFYFLVYINFMDDKTVWPFIILFFEYFAVGIFLSKHVLAKLVDWHPMYNTVSNVAKAKIKQLLFWPITYPVLFIQR